MTPTQRKLIESAMSMLQLALESGEMPIHLNGAAKPEGRKYPRTEAQREAARRTMKRIWRERKKATSSTRSASR